VVVVEPAAPEPEKSMNGFGFRSFTYAAFVTALLIGCGSKDDSSGTGFTPLSTMGTPGVPSPTLAGDNLMLVDVTVDGHSGGRLVVDTGSPFTILNGALFAGVTLPAQDQITADLGVGSLTIDKVPALQATGGMMNQLRLAGLLGGNVLRQFATTFNYRDRELQLGQGALPDGVEASTSVKFQLSGGGLGSLDGAIIAFPATRVPLSADIEGTTHRFVLDTGASDVTLRTSAFDTLVEDGRATIDDLPLSTVNGTSSASATRARSITLSGQTVTNVPVITFDDTIVDSISQELGYTIDGLFGGDFLREFLVTIDYPRGTVELRRYSTRDFIVDEFKRVGFWLTTSGATGFVVGAVHPGSDAAKKGVAADDEILAIDGEALSGLDVLTSDSLLNGSVGQTHRIQFGRTQSSALAQTEVDILIEDLLPAPN
jgi:Aspartyl protease/PDZ domain